MARTESKMTALGSEATHFSLPDVVKGTNSTLEELKGNNATIIAFICNHCPFVKHVNQQLIELALDYKDKGVSFIAISANDTEQYPDDGPEDMKKTAISLGYPFPYLFDETQEVARAYDAACTPDFFIYNLNLSLVYRGQLDDSRPGNGIPVTGKDIRAALDALIEGREVSVIQKPSIGCNIKWKA